MLPGGSCSFGSETTGEKREGPQEQYGTARGMVTVDGHRREQWHRHPSKHNRHSQRGGPAVRLGPTRLCSPRGSTDHYLSPRVAAARHHFLGRPLWRPCLRHREWEVPARNAPRPSGRLAAILMPVCLAYHPFVFHAVLW